MDEMGLAGTGIAKLAPARMPITPNVTRSSASGSEACIPKVSVSPILTTKMLAVDGEGGTSN